MSRFRRLRSRLRLEYLEERVTPVGGLDLSFATTGWETYNLGTYDTANSLVIQPNGQYVVGGDDYGVGQGNYTMARFNSNGTLDTTFNGGKFQTNLGAGSGIDKLVLDGNQIIAVGGIYEGKNQIVMVRYNSDGSVDTNFGNNGVVIWGSGNSDSPVGAMIYNNQIYIGGSYVNSSSQFYYAVWRYNLDGTPDTTFGNNGMAFMNVGTTASNCSPRSMTVLSDGRILVVGGSGPNICVACFNNNGTADTTFGNHSGYALTIVPGMVNSGCTSVLVQADGNILVGGAGGNSAGDTPIDLARFTPKGQLDTTFNGNGMEEIFLGGNEEIATLAQLTNGQILAAGPINGENFIFRMNLDGTLDNSWGTNGFLDTTFSGPNSEFSAMLIDPSGEKIVGVGQFGNSAGIARFLTMTGPVLSGIETSPIFYTAGQGAVAITGALTVADPSSTTIASATVSITAGFASSEDVLGFSNQNGITGGYNSSTGVLTLIGAASLADYQTALQSVTYSDTNSINPSETTRTISFQVNDGTSSPPQSNTETRNIEISTHWAPILAGIESNPLTYTEGDAPESITNTMTVTDYSSSTVASATVAITSNFAGAEDVLAFANQNDITGSYNAATGVLTLTGTASLAAYQTALQSVTYVDGSQDPSTAVRTVSFQVDDGASINHASNIETRNIDVVAVNNAPVLTIPASGPGGSRNIDIAVNGISAADVDAEGGLENLALNVSQGTVRFVNLAGISVVGGANNSANLTVQGTIAEFNAALADGNLIYRSVGTFTGTDDLNLTLDDNGNTGIGGPLTDSKTLPIQVVAHTAPVLSKIEATTLGFTEGGVAEKITNSLTVSAFGTTLVGATVSITGNFAGAEDVLGFVNQLGITGSYNPATGVLTLTGAATVAGYQSALRSVTYVNKSQDPSTAVRTISFQVNDGFAFNPLSNIASRAISVTAVNTAPVLTVPGGPINGSANTDLPVNGISAADVDANGGNEKLSLSVSHGTIGFTSLAGVVVISGTNFTSTLTVQGTIAQLDAALANSNLVYHSAINFIGNDNLNLTLNDEGNTGTGGAKSTSKTVVLHITHVAPVLANIEPTTLSFVEGNPVTTTSTLTISVSDSVNLTGATVSLSAGFVKNEDVLRFTRQSGINGLYNASTGVLTLSGTSSVANYQAALRSVIYTDSSPNPATNNRTITFQVNDGASSNNLSNTQSRAVSVTAVNNPPVLTIPGTAPHGVQNQDIPINGISTADVDANNGIEDLTLTVGNGTIRFVSLAGITIDGGANASASVTVGGTIAALNHALAAGNLIYHSNSNFTGTESLALTLDDNGNTGIGGPFTDAKTISITVNPHSPPVLAGIETSTLSFTEGNVATKVTNSLTVTDSDSITLVGATVSIAANYVPGEDVLTFISQNGITGTFDSAAGVLTLSGVASVATYQSVLRSVAYLDNSQDPSTTTRTISFQVDDGAVNNHLSNVVSRQVSVISVNTPPVLTVPPNGFSGGSNIDIELDGIGASDVDANGGSEKLTLSVSHGKLRFANLDGLTIISGANSSATLTVQGTLAQMNDALANGNLFYHSNSTFTGTDTLTVTLNDNGNTGTGGPKSVSKSVKITVR